jgi:DNA-binding beta-propeller fold protein YncE
MIHPSRSLLVFASMGILLTGQVPRLEALVGSARLELTWGSFGNGPGQFHQPKGIDIDSNGQVLVLDTQNDRVQVFTPEGALVDIWGMFPPGDSAFERPSDLVVNASGQVAISHSVQYWVNVFQSSGQYIFKFGLSGSYTSFTTSDALTVDADGNYFVCENGYSSGWYSQIEKLDAQGHSLFTFGKGALGLAPQGIAIASNRIIVSDSGKDRVMLFGLSGEYPGQWLGPGTELNQVRKPHGITISTDGNIYLADTGNHRIQMFGPGGNLLLAWGSFGIDPGQFRYPWDVAVDASGAVYVTDTFNHRVEKFRVTYPEALPLVKLIRPTTWGRIKANFH